MSDVIVHRGRALDLVQRVGKRPGSRRVRLLPNGGSEDRPDVFHVEFDPSTENVVNVIVRAVAVIHNVEPAHLDPLGAEVDAEALQSLLGRQSPVEASIAFTYQGLRITVTNDGHVWLEWQ